MKLHMTLAALGGLSLSSIAASPPPAKAVPAAPVVAAVSQERCDAYQADITRGLKDASFFKEMSEAGIDNSVPRLTLNAIKHQNALSVVGMTLQSMLGAGCAAPASVDPEKYARGARACAASVQMTGQANAQYCDRTTW